MIVDVLENSWRYLALCEGFRSAFEFLANPGLHELTPGRYPTDDERVLATVVVAPGRERDRSKLEAHQAYLDIQLVLAGIDRMGWKPGSSCRLPAGEYDRETDLQLFNDEPELWLTVPPGVFVVFSPSDAHMSMISAGEIHKIIVKVPIQR